MTRRHLAAWTPVLLVTLGGARAYGQAPQIADVWPSGGPVGTTVSAQVEGANLGGVSAIYVSGRGVKAELGKGDGGKVPVTLTIASDATPGPHEVRVASPKGVSGPGYVWVDAVPQVAEAEPDNQPDQAMKLTRLPITVCGKADAPEDVDWYTFDAEAGDTYVFDVCASRIYSPLDPYLELQDTQGHLLGMGTEGYERDPRLIHTFKIRGTYRVQMRDTLYRGGPGYVYRLTIGKLPAINALYPPGGRRGERLQAQVTGANLGGMDSVTLDLPKEMPEHRRWYVMPNTPNGPALPVAIVADDDPQVIRPPGSDQPIGLPVPATVNGRIETRTQVDGYLFTGVAGRPVELVLRARTIGSRLDGYLRIRDTSGKELLNTDDQAGRDPRVLFNPPAAGAYRVEVSSLDGTGGPDYFYRLQIRPSGIPDFEVAASPDIINLGHGQSALVTVTVARNPGYDAPITIRVEGLPAGVTASPLVLGPGQSSGTLTLTAGADAPLAHGELRIVAEASGARGEKIARVAVSTANLPRPGEGQAVPRPVAFRMAAVTDAIPLYTLAPESQEVTIAPGETVMIKVRATRQAGNNAANGAIALTLASLPPGVSAETPAIAEKQAEATIKFTAAKDAKPATGYALLTGKLGENAEPAPVIVVTVKPK